MRTLSRLVLVAAVVATAAAPASAAVPKLVTVEFNPFVVCVTEPCPQPVPVTVCVHVPADDPTCTPR